MYDNQFLNYFASRLKAHNQWTTPAEARKLFESVTSVLPDIDDLRSYLVYCHIIPVPISTDSATAFKRVEATTDTPKNISSVTGQI